MSECKRARTRRKKAEEVFAAFKLTPEPGTPLSAFLMIDTLLVMDHVRQTVIVIRVTGVEDGETADVAYDRAMREIDALAERFLSAAKFAAELA